MYASRRNRSSLAFLWRLERLTKQTDKIAKSPKWPTLLPKYIKRGRGVGRGGECTTPLSDFHLLRFTFLNLHFIFHPGRLATFHINCMVPCRRSPSVFVLLLLFLGRVLNGITLIIWLGRRAFLWAGIITWSCLIPRWQLGVQEMQGVPIKTQWQKCLWRERCGLTPETSPVRSGPTPSICQTCDPWAPSLIYLTCLPYTEQSKVRSI